VEATAKFITAAMSSWPSADVRERLTIIFEYHDGVSALPGIAALTLPPLEF